MNFPTTQWALIERASLNGGAAGSEALAQFYRAYQGPVVGFIRRRGFAPHEAEDVAQDFLVHLLKKSVLRRADATRGRFRSYLLGALVRFLGDVRDRQSRLKRGGDCTHCSLDRDLLVETIPQPSCDDALAFDRAWACELLKRALEGIAAEYTERHRASAFEVLRAYLPGSVHTLPYLEAASRLGMALPALKTEVHRLRVRFRERLRAEIAATVSSPQEIDEEITHLGRVLFRASN